MKFLGKLCGHFLVCRYLSEVGQGIWQYLNYYQEGLNLVVESTKMNTIVGYCSMLMLSFASKLDINATTNLQQPEILE